MYAPIAARTRRRRLPRVGRRRRTGELIQDTGVRAGRAEGRVVELEFVAVLPEVTGVAALDFVPDAPDGEGACGGRVGAVVDFDELGKDMRDAGGDGWGGSFRCDGGGVDVYGGGGRVDRGRLLEKVSIPVSWPVCIGFEAVHARAGRGDIPEQERSRC